MIAIHSPLNLRSLLLLALSAVCLFAVACDDGPGPHDGHAHDGHEHAGHEDHAEVGEPSAAAILAAHKHDDPNQTCFMCDAAKRDKGRLWCKEHVRYEDRCWLCHEELEDKDRLYCKEHFLYEDECHLCHPELKDGGEAAVGDSHDHQGHGHQASNASSADGHDHGSGSAHEQRNGRVFCSEHDMYEDECGICQPGLAKTMQPGQNLKVRFPSPQSADKAGVSVGQPQQGESAPVIEALCEVQYNLNAMARVTPLADGVIRKVQHDVGDRVEAGDILVEIHSDRVATAKSDFLAAVVQRDISQQSLARQERLRDQNISAEKDLLEAQASHRSANLQANSLRQRLMNLGFNEQEIQQIQRDQDTSARLLVRAPFAGTLVERNAVVGEAIDTEHSVFTVADLSSRWLVLSVPSRYLAQLRKGQTVAATFDELPGLEVRGEITWIDSAIDARSRMIKARALITQDADRIKTGLYGKAQVVIGNAQPATIVPRNAVQRHEGGTFVFVRNEPDLFSLRRVALGQSDGQTIDVLAGLTANDPVVTEGGFVVMSEFLKSRLGAGCADH